ncbi:exodeoxyribonuclease VII large subunit, partial [Frankia sp. EI5c]|uniref:exodeoxyribonuclease VII large subunit n=1 Tax=Frankia sp. EI5c TaxID=683316 RepID=UPI001F5B6474
PLAVAQILDALAELDADSTVEVIVIARGGGSLEDLLPFSDEALLRAVVAARTPVVSAIGHEQDTPLLDFVADARASTPTDAAKRVVPDVAEQAAGVDALRGRARRVLVHRLDLETRRLADLRGRPVLAAPLREIEHREQGVEALRTRSRRCVAHAVDVAERDLVHAAARMRALSPAATLERGYALIQKLDGQVVRSPADVAGGEMLAVRVAGGSFAARAQAAGATGAGAGEGGAGEGDSE